MMIHCFIEAFGKQEAISLGIIFYVDIVREMFCCKLPFAKTIVK